MPVILWQHLEPVCQDGEFTAQKLQSLGQVSLEQPWIRSTIECKEPWLKCVFTYLLTSEGTGFLKDGLSLHYDELNYMRIWIL